MDLLKNDWNISSKSEVRPAQYIGKEAKVKNSLIVEGCRVYGTIENSVLFEGVFVGKNTVIMNSVIMPNARIEDNVKINKAIVGNGVIIRANSKVGSGNEVEIVSSDQYLNTNNSVEFEELR